MMRSSWVLFFLIGCGGATTTIDGDAGNDAANDGSSGHVTCNGQTCGSGQVCVKLTAGGGACQIPEDGGLCPNGQPYNGGCCDNTTTTYTCTMLPSACNGTLACPCAESLCQCGGCDIDGTGALACQCMYP